MKKIFLMFVMIFVAFRLFANPLTKVTENEWVKTSETGYDVQYEKNGVVLYHFSQVDKHYVTLKDNEMHLAYEGSFKEVKAVVFELLHNRVPEVEWILVKDNEPTGRILARKADKWEFINKDE